MVFITLKYIVIGDSEVGKSSLLWQFTEEKFKNNHELTIGVEYASKTLEIAGQSVKLEVWDTAGQEIYLSITRSYYRGADVVVLVYDVGRRITFENLSMWLDECYLNCQNTNMHVIVVGMKTDLPPASRQVSKEEGSRWAEKHNCDFIEASAKFGTGVSQVFSRTASKILENYNRAHYRRHRRNSSFKLDDSDFDKKEFTGYSAGECCGL